MSLAKQTIAIVGAGPGVGFAVAARFAREGFNVALVSRNRRTLDAMIARLQGNGAEVAAFAADVTVEDDLTGALKQVSARFGAIDVIEFSPTVSQDSLRPPREMTVENERYHLELQVIAPIAIVMTVLPAMLERKRGSLLFTTAASAQHPAAMTASFGVAAGGLLNYVRLLHDDLAPLGIRAGLVSIAGLVDPETETDIAKSGAFPPGIPIVKASAIADLHWRIHAGTSDSIVFAGDMDALLKNPGLYPPASPGLNSDQGGESFAVTRSSMT